MKIKVIDLLNKIANCEAPTNIKIGKNEYYLYDDYSYLTTDKRRFFTSIFFCDLNKEIEIIEKENNLKRKC